MITINERIEVPSSPETVWRVLSDPREVMSCIGGAELGEEHEDGSFDAKIAVRFGGLRVAFAARAALELDELERAGQLTARGADRQGGTRVRSETTFRVHPTGGASASQVAIGGEVNLSGKLASVIDAGAGVVITRMTREFAAALSERCAALEVPAGAALSSPGVPDVTVPTVRPGVLARFRAWWRGLTRGRAHGARS